MKTIIVTTQAELDALPSSFPEFTAIEIRSPASEEIVIRRTPDSSTVTACGSSTVTAYDSSTVTAYNSSTVTACGSSTVTAYGSSTVTAYGSSTVTAYDSSTVTACDSSTVTAYGSSTVTAYNSSTVTAYDSSTVTAYGFAVVIVRSRTAKAKRAGKTAKVVRSIARLPRTVAEWIGYNDAKASGGFLTLYKRVSAGWLTQECTANATRWQPGDVLVHPAWAPETGECGAGKFHGCPAPRYCDEFRSKAGDRYVAIKVAKKDCKVWPDAQYPHKIAFRAGTVLHECDKNGKKIG